MQLYYKPVKDEFKIENKGETILFLIGILKSHLIFQFQSIDTKDWKLESDSVAVNFKAKISEKKIP